jgi:hypothetical protein
VADYFDSHIEVAYLNKPYFVQLKRIWRMAKKIQNPEKAKKIGFYLQQAKTLEGSAQTNEKIIRSIFGNKQEMSPSDFIKGVFDHETPEGKKMFVRPEEAYQTTQRLVSNETKNKTLSVSIFGEIYDEILDSLEKKYGKEKSDEIARNMNKFLSSHFNNAAMFVRWTEMSPSWIHFDAFQTDFFNEIKAFSNKNEEFKPVADEIRSHEDAFFKTAVSFVVRKNPGVKVFTANTEDMVKAVERVKGDVKLKKYYYQLPKKLGFKLISLQDFYNKVIRTRPSKKAEKLIGSFDKAIQSYGGSKSDFNVKKYNKQIEQNIAFFKEQKKVSTPEAVNSIINNLFANEPQVASAYHQYINELSEIIKKKKSIKNFLASKEEEIESALKETVKITDKKIWWSNRGLIFENTNVENRMLKENILKLSKRI